MVRDSLNLVGDEGLEEHLEDVFDLRFSDSEFAAMVDVGAIHDVIDSRIPARPGACQTSMAFYRLRQGLIAMGMTGRIRPATRLPSAFVVQTNQSLRTLSASTGLKLPPTYTGPLMTGCFILGCGALLSFCVGLLFQLSILGWIAAAAVAASIVLAILDRGRLPEKFSTVGGLARASAPLNFGKLVRQGGDVNSSLTWAVLCEILADTAEIEPEEIGRKTAIYPLKKAAA